MDSSDRLPVTRTTSSIATRAAGFLLVAAIAFPLATPHPAEAQARSVDTVLDSVLLADYQWRNLGPDRGGRSIAVSGVRWRRTSTRSATARARTR